MQKAVVVMACLFVGTLCRAVEPVVAIHDSEWTRALETIPASGMTPTGAGTTGFEWWQPSWHYFVMPESLKEAFRSDGTAFQVVSDADISSGMLMDGNGGPRFPILLSLACEAVTDEAVAQLTNYVAAGGFLLVGSSSFTRHTNGTSRGDFAIANEMDIHMVNAAHTNWTRAGTFSKKVNHQLVDHLRGGDLRWRMPGFADEISSGVSPAHFSAPNPLLWMVEATNAIVLAQAGTLPRLVLKQFGDGQFIYDASMQPLMGHGGFSPAMHSYMIYHRAIEWAFAVARLPLPRLSPWPYEYDAAFVMRHELDLTNEVAGIEASAQFEQTNGVLGDYYFASGMLRENLGNSPAIVNSLRRAVSDYSATIGINNGGLTNPVNPSLTASNYDYWHWGPDEVLDLAIPNYASGRDYATASISNALADVDGWLTGLANGNGVRSWVSPWFNATREDSFVIQQELGIDVAGEQKLTPFPHWTLSTETSGKRYPTLSLPLSDWYVGTLVSPTVEFHVISTVRRAVDFLYDNGALLNISSHNLSTNSLPREYITYSMNTNLHPRLWSANAAGIYEWWLQRSNAQISASYVTTNGGQSVATLSVAGATDPESAVEFLLQPITGGVTGLEVLTNGVLAGGDAYRINGNVVKVHTGTTVSTVVLRYFLSPLAISDFYTVQSGGNLSVSAPGVLLNDAEGVGPGPLNASLDSGTSHGLLNLNANGGFTYAPNTSFSGVDGFTYVTGDGGAASSGPAVALISVLPEGALFYDDFARPAGTSGLTPWQTALGTWTITNGVLLGSSPFESYGHCFLSNDWTDYSVQIKARLPTNGYSFMLGGRLNPGTGAHYGVTVFPFNGTNWVLRLIKFSSWAAWSGMTLATQPDVMVASPGTNLHTLKMTFTGNLIQVDYDGVRVMEVTDNGFEGPAYASGGIAVGMYTTSNNYNLQVEEVLVSDPNPSESFKIQSINRLNGLVTLTWQSQAGKTYRMQYKENPDEGGWTDVSPDVPATGATTSGTNSAGSAPRQFYRVLRLP